MESLQVVAVRCWRTLVFVVAVAVACVAAGCSIESSDADGTATGDELEQRLPDVSVELPSLSDGADVSLAAPETAVLSWELQRTLLIAEDHLIGECMNAAGFEFTAAIPPAVLPGVGSQTYGSDDVAAAEVDGYGISGGGSGFEDPNAEYLAGLSDDGRDRFTLALFGSDDTSEAVDAGGLEVSVNADGCLADARSRLYGDSTEWVGLSMTIDGVRSQVISLVFSDPRFVEANAEWSSCMAAKGYGFGDPGEARTAAAAAHADMDADNAAAFEREVAVADAGCIGAAGVLPIARQLEAGYLTAVLDQREGEIVAYRAMVDSALEEWREIVGE